MSIEPLLHRVQTTTGLSTNHYWFEYKSLLVYGVNHYWFGYETTTALSANDYCFVLPSSSRLLFELTSSLMYLIHEWVRITYYTLVCHRSDLD